MKKLLILRRNGFDSRYPKEQKMDEQYKSVVNLLPKAISNILLSVDVKISQITTEIRLRAGKPLALTTDSGILYLEEVGYSLIPTQRSRFIAEDELKDAFLRLCNNSVYSHEQELKQGYLTLCGGHRAGICGHIVTKPNGEYWITDVSSINIRIAREVKGVAESVYGKTLYGKGLLICGPPHSGKTTYLRDYLRISSDRGERVAIVDCRGEIAAVRNSICGLDVGVNTDVITGGAKADGIEKALRVLTPDIIAFDEIGSKEELEKISDCFNSGVRVVTTIHCSNSAELLERNRYLPILNTGMFTHLIFLDLFHKVTVLEECELFAENNRHDTYNNIVFGAGSDPFSHSL